MIMKDLDFNKIVIASLLFLPSLFHRENTDVFFLIICAIACYSCIYSLTVKRESENIYRYYLFKVLAVVYILSFLYNVVRYFHLESYL